MAIATSARLRAWSISGTRPAAGAAAPLPVLTAGRAPPVRARDYPQPPTASLLKDLRLTPYVAGVRVDLLDIVFKPLQGAILPLLQSVTSQLDPILFKLLSGLGIGLGQADVRVTGATCGRSVLVQ